MARGRMISKSLSTSRKFAQLPKIAGELGEFCQLLFPLIVSHADDHGRMSGDAFTVKFQVFPISPRPEEDFEAAIRHLDTARLIDSYEVGGDKFIQVIEFDSHQTGLHKRIDSKFPEIPGSSRNPPEIPGKEKGREGKGTELNRTEGKGTAPVALVPRARTGSGVMAGALPRDHIRHSWCSERICVPDFLHGRFSRALGGETADGMLKAFYAETVEHLPGGPIESDPVKFWPPLVSHRWPPQDASVGTRTAALQRATAEFVRGGVK
jgi:hypothetical protein